MIKQIKKILTSKIISISRHECCEFKCSCGPNSKKKFADGWRSIFPDLSQWAERPENRQQIKKIKAVDEATDRDKQMEMPLLQMIDFVFRKIDSALAHNNLQHVNLLQVLTE